MDRSLAALDGKLALVTGAGAGIGRASAIALAAQGAWVAVVDRDATSAESVASEIRSGGGRAIAVIADVSLAEDASRIAATARDELGGLDTFHNNTCILRDVEV